MAKTQSNLPTNKVLAGGAVGAVSTLLIYVLNTHVLSDPLPADVAGAITVLVTFVASYLMPPAQRDQVVPSKPIISVPS